MTYAELSTFGRLRKVYRCGPYSMFTRLVQDWGDRLSVEEVGGAGGGLSVEEVGRAGGGAECGRGGRG